VIQAFLIKHFVFENRPKEKSIALEKLLKPSESEQICALWTCMSEIIWNIGEKKKAVVCLPCDSKINFNHLFSLTIIKNFVSQKYSGQQQSISHTNQYFQDNITEKVMNS